MKEAMNEKQSRAFKQAWKNYQSKNALGSNLFSFSLRRSFKTGWLSALGWANEQAKPKKKSPANKSSSKFVARVGALVSVYGVCLDQYQSKYFLRGCQCRIRTMIAEDEWEVESIEFKWKFSVHPEQCKPVFRSK